MTRLDALLLSWPHAQFWPDWVHQCTDRLTWPDTSTWWQTWLIMRSRNSMWRATSLRIVQKRQIQIVFSFYDETEGAGSAGVIKIVGRGLGALIDDMKLITRLIFRHPRPSAIRLICAWRQISECDGLHDPRTWALLKSNLTTLSGVKH